MHFFSRPSAKGFKKVLRSNPTSDCCKSINLDRWKSLKMLIKSLKSPELGKNLQSALNTAQGGTDGSALEESEVRALMHSIV